MKSYKQIQVFLAPEEADMWTKLAKTLEISRTEMLRRAVRALIAIKGDLDLVGHQSSDQYYGQPV
jgi:hypothetical protein